MKRLKFILPLLLILVSVSMTACKKKCIIDADDTLTGDYIENVVFYPESGYLTSNMGGNYVIDANHPYADRIFVSINEGGKVPVNYSNYTVLCYPIVAKCNAVYDRTVTIDHANQTVVYKIAVTQCDNCKEERMTENYVLVPAFPSNYTVSYDITYTDK
jgi:hypothetical protein